MVLNVGSVCSGIEAASVAWADLRFNFEWFSEIESFPSKVLKYRYPHIQNLGDMTYLSKYIYEKSIGAPDLICCGTPCQAFSLMGKKEGLRDKRGNLTLSFIDIVNQNDKVRETKGQSPTMVLWENVEGILGDKTNAFGAFISALAGLETTITVKKWSRAGVLKGPKRNIAWRVLDAKYFGLPQQRKRVYLLASGKDFEPETVLFEKGCNLIDEYPQSPLTFEVGGSFFECFRSYTNCLYAAYGTKWNGNAAAYNGSLFTVQDKRLRRFSPLECERLMGFPDNYTNVPKAFRTNRYKAIGNSWAVPVIKWIGERILEPQKRMTFVPKFTNYLSSGPNYHLCLLKTSKNRRSVNYTPIPNDYTFGKLSQIVTPTDVSEKLYISSTGASGILRRCEKRGISMNPRLKDILNNLSISV